MRLSTSRLTAVLCCLVLNATAFAALKHREASRTNFPIELEAEITGDKIHVRVPALTVGTIKPDSPSNSGGTFNTYGNAFCNHDSGTTMVTVRITTTSGKHYSKQIKKSVL